MVSDGSCHSCKQRYGAQRRKYAALTEAHQFEPIAVETMGRKKQQIFIYHVNSSNHINTREPQKLVKIVVYASVI